MSVFLEHDFPVWVVSAFPSPLGLGRFQFEDTTQRENLLDASPLNFGQWVITVRRHDEARNFRSCAYIRQCWIMLLGFPLDFQSVDFVRASVAPFGRFLRWYEGPNKSRLLAKCLILSPDCVPRNVVVSHGTTLGGSDRSWSVPVYMLNGQFPDGFPADEDPVPFDGNPHPVNGDVLHANPDAQQGWQHDLHGAAQHVHEDFGLNVDQVAAIHDELIIHHDPDNQNDGYDAWPILDVGQEVNQNENEPLQADHAEQESIFLIHLVLVLSISGLMAPMLC